MLSKLACIFLLAAAAAAAPQQMPLPALQDFSPPEEVNAVLQNSSPKVQRSISSYSRVDNTEDTIKEVERLIKANANLPRLTRGEILDILENITKHDQSNLLKSIGTNRDPKAFMVVKAYTPALGSEGENNMESFYTKPPVTTIVQDQIIEVDTISPQTVKTTTENAIHLRRKTTKTYSESKKQYESTKRKPSRGNSPFKTTTGSTIESSTSRGNKRVITTERPQSTTQDYYYTSTPKRDIIKRRRRPIATITSTTTEMLPTTYRPRRRQPTRKEIQHETHKYQQENGQPSYYPSQGIKLVPSPVMTKPAGQINYELEDLLPQSMENQEIFIPMPLGNKQNLVENSQNHQTSLEIEVPEPLKKVAEDIYTENMKLLPALQHEEEKVKNPAKVFSFSSSTTEPPNAFAVAENLSPEMREILKNFGLFNDPNEIPVQNDSSVFNPERAETDPKSYKGFKPLPQDKQSRKEMEALLEEFGLIDKRTGKYLRKNQTEKKIISLDIVPNDFKPVLIDMGFEDASRKARKIRQQPLTKTQEKITEDQQHVFNPQHSVKLDEIAKLHKLLLIMRKLETQNGTVTEGSMDQSDKDELKFLLNSLKEERQKLVTLEEQEAPNPNVESAESLMKNEVKRQKEDNKENVTEEIVTVTAQSLPEGTDVTASIKDLEASFGGSTETATETLPEPTTRRRSGFYYLMDWNSFFEIDDQKGKRVNLRFQPKVGDPKRFFSVNIP
ncbi:uncharacterized protein [Euwallacea fornicatus]|uniref:uncharacterized protein n=1 Tax=Euwallacea fornicatus TaxID=995702 RepID=UPI00338E9F7D